MQIPIQEIQIKNRIRKNLGDLAGLKDSIQKHGILNPVVINSKNELVAGHRRLESARQLGWNMIPVRIIDEKDAADKVEIEIEENLYRKNLSADELAEAYEYLERLKNPGWFTRFLNFIKDFFRRLFKRGSSS
ncbi:ParB N-terminal domain-containing protein [Salinispira pacifica]|uniref:Chromosome (Plasmid) partitioning protein ParB n=1 Tax=Salinispira pacifica TaxID=1307761 RepID=V5WI10_9SPIO|nr:ParB N-terminal domain-containing protein [Salinispira pacifica]AHC14806.1 Chromosome (plasmid) partitioning protein ParB [Salinispira pacifica]